MSKRTEKNKEEWGNMCLVLKILYAIVGSIFVFFLYAIGTFCWIVLYPYHRDSWKKFMWGTK